MTVALAAGWGGRAVPRGAAHSHALWRQWLLLPPVGLSLRLRGAVAVGGHESTVRRAGGFTQRVFVAAPPGSGVLSPAAHHDGASVCPRAGWPSERLRTALCM